MQITYNIIESEVFSPQQVQFNNLEWIITFVAHLCELAPSPTEVRYFSKSLLILLNQLSFRWYRVLS